jgi:hypothetical protein
LPRYASRILAYLDNKGKNTERKYVSDKLYRRFILIPTGMNSIPHQVHKPETELIGRITSLRSLGDAAGRLGVEVKKIRCFCIRLYGFLEEAC